MKKTKQRAVSFAGCSWLLTYHLGVGKFIQKKLDPDDFCFAGASSGSIAALTMATGIDVEESYAFIHEKASESQSRILGPFGRMTGYLKEGFLRLLPKNASESAADRLFVSVTELPLFKNRLFQASDVHTNEDILQAVLASCYIPLYYERPVFFEGRFCIDGGLTDNCPRPVMDTITVCPPTRFHKNRADIHPPTVSLLKHAFLPKTDILKTLFDQGIKDAENFFTKNARAKASRA